MEQQHCAAPSLHFVSELPEVVPRLARQVETEPRHGTYQRLPVSVQFLDASVGNTKRASWIPASCGTHREAE